MIMNISNKQFRTIATYAIILLIVPSVLSINKGGPRVFNPWPLGMCTILLAVALSYDSIASYKKQLLLGLIIGLIYGFASVAGFVIDFLIFSEDKNIDYVWQLVFSFKFYFLLIAWGLTCSLAVFAYKKTKQSSHCQ